MKDACGDMEKRSENPETRVYGTECVGGEICMQSLVFKHQGKVYHLLLFFVVSVLVEWEQQEEQGEQKRYTNF